MLQGTLIRAEGDTLVEPIQAWRAWTLTGRRDGSEVRLRPIAGSTRAWPVLVPARATCSKRRLHAVPGARCACGLHAVSEPFLLRRARNPAVVGTVALWGRVVEHEHGFRAELAYPQRLRLVCHLCFWRTGTAAPAPDVVIRLRGGRMVPLCLEHLEASERYGYPVPRLVPAYEVEGSMLSAYGVDLLRDPAA